MAKIFQTNNHSWFCPIRRTQMELLLIFDGDGSTSSDEKELSVQFLEEDYDQLQEVDDLDVSCGAFCGESPVYVNTNGTPRFQNLPVEAKHKAGTTIAYVPTRK